MQRPRSFSVNKKKAFLKKSLFVAFVTFLGFLVILFTVVAHTLSPEDQVDTCQNVESGRYLFDPYGGQENFRLCHSKEARLTGRLGEAITGLDGTSVKRERKSSTHALPCTLIMCVQLCVGCVQLCVVCVCVGRVWGVWGVLSSVSS